MIQANSLQRYKQTSDGGGGGLNESPHWGVQEANLYNIHQGPVLESGSGDPGAEKLDGKGIKVAIMDGAVDIDHCSFRKGLHKSFDFVTDSVVEYSDKSQSHLHGTMVAGIIGADCCHNTMRLHGVAPGASLYCYRVMDSSRHIVPYALEKSLICAMEEGVHIINLSLRHLPIDHRCHGLIREANYKGIVLVAQAGNYRNREGVDNLDYPAAYQETIAVGAHARNTYDAAKARGQGLDFTAPGDSLCCMAPDNQFTIESGSSLASSYVAGLIALAMQIYVARTSEYPQAGFIEQELRHCTHTDRFDSNKYGYGSLVPEKVINHFRNMNL